MSALFDKVVVVVGGTAGLGFSASKTFVLAGARVVLVGRNPRQADAAQKALGPSALALVADAAAPDTAERAIAAARRQFGGFHALYHVAGGSGRGRGDGPLHKISQEGWDYTLRLNLTSLFLSNRAAARQFIKQKSAGTILNMGSVLGASPSPRFFSTHAYATAKAAIVGLTRAAAAYYAPKNIRFNVLAPALVETPMSTRACQDPAITQYIHTKQPLDGGRVGRPEDLDAAALYLISDQSRFVTGQVLVVDGGWSISEGQVSPRRKRRGSTARKRKG